MPRRGENIYKRKDGRWEARYIMQRSPEGRTVYGYLYARTYRDVKAKRQQSKGFSNFESIARYSTKNSVYLASVGQRLLIF